MGSFHELNECYLIFEIVITKAFYLLSSPRADTQQVLFHWRNGRDLIYLMMNDDFIGGGLVYYFVSICTHRLFTLLFKLRYESFTNPFKPRHRCFTNPFVNGYNPPTDLNRLSVCE